MATPPTSYGYPGSINAAALAAWLPAAAAARFSVAGAEDWRVTVQGGLDRGIRINAGTGTGDGIMDITAEYETMALPLVESGSQWFLVVRRRNWAVPATTVPMIIDGTATKALPARSDTPGVESDQPLALCRVTAGQTVVQEIIDLRCWAGNGGVVAADEMALAYLARPGADVLIGSTPWRFAKGPNDTWAWSRPYSMGADVIAISTSDTAWAYGVRLSRTLSVDGKETQVVMSFLIARLSGPAFTIEAAAERTLLTGLIPAGWRPADAGVYGAAVVSGPSWGGVGICVNTSGALTVRSTGGNTPISNGSRITATIAWKLPVS